MMIKLVFNQLYATGLFLYPMKTKDQRYRKRLVAANDLTSYGTSGNFIKVIQKSFAVPEKELKKEKEKHL